MKDYIGDYCRGYQGDTRSLDSYEHLFRSHLGGRS